MLRSSKCVWVLGFAVASLLVGCASWVPVAYTANPAAVTNPAEDFQRLAMTAKVWRPTTVEMHDTFATLQYIGAGVPGGVQTVTVPFNEIEKIDLLQSGTDFAVRAMDAAGAAIYEYAATDQKKAQEMIDVLTALKAAKPAG